MYKATDREQLPDNINCSTYPDISNTLYRSEQAMEPTSDLSFSTILDCLSCGREIEFSYHGKAYSITNDSQGNWNFYCDTDRKSIQCICPFEDQNTLLSFVRKQSIDGTPISEIFDKMLYDNSSVCIL